MRFLIDNQLPVRLAIHLRTSGHDVVHVLDAGWDEDDHVDLWQRALADDRVLVSKDEDFVYLAGRPNDAGRLL